MDHGWCFAVAISNGHSIIILVGSGIPRSHARRARARRPYRIPRIRYIRYTSASAYRRGRIPSIYRERMSRRLMRGTLLDPAIALVPSLYRVPYSNSRAGPRDGLGRDRTRTRIRQTRLHLRAHNVRITM